MFKTTTLLIIYFNIALITCNNNKGKIWKWTTNIFHKTNWQTIENCNDGKVIFGLENSAPIFIREKLKTSAIELPENGQLILMENATIEFRQNLGKCRKFESINFHEWYNPENWITDNNPATPDLERIPCDFDDVYLPDLLNSGISISGENEENLQLHSLFSNGQKLENLRMLQEFLDSDLGQKAIFRNFPDKFRISLTPTKCQNSTGCPCHKKTQVFCDNFPENSDETNCETPLLPIGFCHQICGSFIQFPLENGFNLAKFKKEIRTNDDGGETHLHISKVYDSDKEIIQIVLKEENYEGNSVRLGREIYEKLLQDNYKFVDFYTSGNAIIKVGNSVSLIFASLFGVLLLFALIFYTYDENCRKFRYLPRRNRPFSAYFNRKENKLIINESLQGSVISLEKSFDNPMYEEHSPSTSLDTIKSDIIHENPMYDIKLKDELEE